MKKQLLLLVSLTFIASQSFAQPDDRQWLIWNSNGWDGSSNTYPSGTAISNTFNIHGVKHPDLSRDPKPRNDLFIMYSDGEHYNTRYQPLPGIFYPPAPVTPANLAEIDHNFQGHYGGGSISYMYMTNRYEEDDPPRKLSVSDGPGPGTISPYPLDKTNALLAANHDVVFTKDITIIVNYDSIMNNDLPPLQMDISKMRILPEDLVLRYDGIKHVSDGTMDFGLDFLDLKNAFDFGTSGSMAPGYPHKSYDTTYTSISQVILRSAPTNEKYRYINLRTNENAYEYGPDLHGNTQDSAVFTIIKNGAPVAMLTEPLVHSHDPNFLEVERICRLDDGSHLVSYLLEFENTSTTPTPSPDNSGPTDGLSVMIDFPAMFDLTCLKKTGWFAGGNPCSIRINTTGARQRQFEFKDEGQLVECQSENDVKCIGRIRFMVKVHAGIDVSDLTTNLKLENMLVYFGNASFPIHKFKDLKECEFIKDPKKDSNENPNPNEPEEDFKKDPKKYPAEPDSSDNNNQAGDTINNNQSGNSSGGYRRCYRPISEGNCRCGSGTGPGIPDALIFALAGIALLLIAVNYSKSKNEEKKRKALQANTNSTP